MSSRDQREVVKSYESIPWNVMLGHPGFSSTSRPSRDDHFFSLAHTHAAPLLVDGPKGNRAKKILKHLNLELK